MRRDSVYLYVLLLLIVLYFSQGVVYPQGSLLSQFILVGILTISLIYFVKSVLLRSKKLLFFRIWTLLLISNIILYLVTADFANSLHFSKLKGLLIVALPFYPFYYFAKKDVLKAVHFSWLFAFILPVAISQFYLERSSILMERVWTENVVNNISYFFVFLVPYLFFFKWSRVISIIGALILMFFIIQGAKRGALITGLAGLLIFVYFQLKNIDKEHKIKSSILAVMSMLVIIYFGIDYYQENEYLIERMSKLSEGGLSGRDIIYRNIFDAWSSSDNVINILFGFGFASSLELSKTGNWAHNDWLEGLAGFGIFGVLLYASLFYSVFKMLFNKNWGEDKKLLLFTILIIWFVSTLFSMNYYNATYSFFQYIVLGYLVGNKSNRIE